MTNANKKKAEQLGIPFGTASNRLRKLILFELTRKLNMDACCRCGKTIETVDDFSIEHVTPWMDSKNPKELFYDLSNIAFSHLTCNTSHVSEANKRAWASMRKIHPAGQAWCCGCKTYKSRDEFHNNRARTNGKANYCKDCRK